jgi:PAS domain S-box-containing protein
MDLLVHRIPSVNATHIFLVGIFALVVHTVIAFISFKQVEGFEKESLAFSKVKMTAQISLRKLSDAFGYGGYIHHFKNIVLRQELHLIPLLEMDARIISASLEELNNNFKNEEVQAAVAVVSATLDEYRSKEIYLIQENSISTENLDQLVRVDDTAALKALRDLNDSIDRALDQNSTVLSNKIDSTKHVFILWMLTSALYLLMGYFVYLLCLKQRKDFVKLAVVTDRLSAVLENSPSAIIICNDEGQITYSNMQANMLFATKNDQILGSKVEKWIPTRFREGHIEKRTNFVINNGTRAMENRQDLLAMRSNGEEFPIKINLVRVKNEHDSIVIAIIHDATFDKKLEKKQIQKRRLESIGRLTAGIGHDFNNMLAVIIGSVNIIEADHIKPNIKLNAVHSIRKASDKAAQLIRKLLTFSREEELKNSQVNMATLLTELNVLMSVAVGEDIDITVLCQPDLWECCLDKVQLESAIMNLTVNAKNAMPRGGEIDITANNYQHSIGSSVGDLEELSPGDYVVIKVSDSGYGMTEEVLEHIFEPFFTATKGGTGLGLSMVFGFVKQSGGTIQVSSELNKGTIFKLYLPRHREDVNDTIKIEEPNIDVSHLKDVRILVVEDDTMVSNVVEELLLMSESVVLKASCEEEAINVALSRTLDFVLSDVVLKNGENGVEIFEKLKRIQPKLKVLYSSGYFESDLRERKLISEDIKVLKKPYNKNDLYKGILEILPTKNKLP